jgi:hypothetical protein
MAYKNLYAYEGDVPKQEDRALPLTDFQKDYKKRYEKGVDESKARDARVLNAETDFLQNPSRYAERIKAKQTELERLNPLEGTPQQRGQIDFQNYMKALNETLREVRSEAENGTLGSVDPKGKTAGSTPEVKRVETRATSEKAKRETFSTSPSPRQSVMTALPKHIEINCFGGPGPDKKEGK